MHWELSKSIQHNKCFTRDHFIVWLLKPFTTNFTLQFTMWQTERENSNNMCAIRIQYLGNETTEHHQVDHSYKQHIKFI